MCVYVCVCGGGGGGDNIQGRSQAISWVGLLRTKSGPSFV